MCGSIGRNANSQPYHFTDVGSVVSRHATHLLGLPLLDAAGEVDTYAAGAEVSAADVAGDRRHGDRCNR